MGARGRKSASAETVIVGKFGKRPDPPSDLTDEQAELWRAVVASEAPEFFATAVTRGLLEDFCRHKTAAAVLHHAIDEFEPEWLNTDGGPARYDLLLRMREREVSAAIRLATKLRLTNQARYTDKAAGTAAKNAGAEQKPWQNEA